MSIDVDTMLRKLADESDGGPADRLALLMLEQLFAAPLSTLVAPPALAAGLREAANGWLRSPEALTALERVLETAVNTLKSSRPVREAMPAPLREVVLELASRPYSPDRRVVLKVLDRGPMRELIRSLVTDTVTAFGTRMAAPAATVTKGLGGLARFAAETVKQRGGTLGGLVGAVESQMEKRSADFADQAISSVLNEIADAVCDPKRAQEAALLRVEALKGAFELTPQELSRELINLDVPGGAAVLRTGLARWLESPGAEKSIAEFATNLRVDRTVGQLLDEVGQRAAARTLGRALLRSRLKALFGSPEYAAWLNALG